jgi:hypothetical protein
MRAALALVLGCLAAAPAWGQDQQDGALRRWHRRGMWGELGSGLAAVRVGCGGCTDVQFSGGQGGWLAIGGTLSHHILLGVEAFGFTDETFGFTEGDTSLVASNATLAMTVTWYPGSSAFFLKGGAGLAAGNFAVAPDTGAVIETEGVGVGLTFGFGYDIPISRKFALTLIANLYLTAIGDIKIQNNFVDDVIAEVYQVALGFTFR